MTAIQALLLASSVDAATRSNAFSSLIRSMPTHVLADDINAHAMMDVVHAVLTQARFVMCITSLYAISVVSMSLLELLS